MPPNLCIAGNGKPDVCSRNTGNIDDAIGAYRRAVRTLQSIRPELSASYGAPQTSFRETMGPVYFELVDLLLQRAQSLQDPNQVGPYLIEARETVELFKAAELRDYFRDDCVDTALSKVTKLDVAGQDAVVIYPILLPDRTRLTDGGEGQGAPGVGLLGGGGVQGAAGRHRDRRSEDRAVGPRQHRRHPVRRRPAAMTNGLQEYRIPQARGARPHRQGRAGRPDGEAPRARRDGLPPCPRPATAATAACRPRDRVVLRPAHLV